MLISLIFMIPSCWSTIISPTPAPQGSTPRDLTTSPHSDWNFCRSHSQSYYPPAPLPSSATIRRAALLTPRVRRRGSICPPTPSPPRGTVLPRPTRHEPLSSTHSSRTAGSSVTNHQPPASLVNLPQLVILGVNQSFAASAELKRRDEKWIYDEGGPERIKATKRSTTPPPSNVANLLWPNQRSMAFLGAALTRYTVVACMFRISISSLVMYARG